MLLFHLTLTCMVVFAASATVFDGGGGKTEWLGDACYGSGTLSTGCGGDEAAARVMGETLPDVTSCSACFE